MSKQIRNKFKYDIPIYHRPIISVDEATAYSGIGRTKLYELTTMENCPFVIWVGTRRVIKRKSFGNMVVIPVNDSEEKGVVLSVEHHTRITAPCNPDELQHIIRVEK